MVFPCITSILFLFFVIACAWPLGAYIAKIMIAPEEVPYARPFLYIEKQFSKMLRGIYTYEMSWKEYFYSFLVFHIVGIVFLYFLARNQENFCFSPGCFPNFSPYQACLFAISFCTNTDMQTYVPEIVMGSVLQTLGITVQQFFSASVGGCLLCVLGRAFRDEGKSTIGNFWKDLVRFSVYVLLPLSILFSVGLMWTGVPQTTHRSLSYKTIEGAEEKVPVGLWASSIAIKQLGTNGGGVTNTNSAHPLENPTPISNILEIFAILLIPVALCRTYGIFVNSQRQGYVLLFVMGSLFFLGLIVAFYGMCHDLPFGTSQIFCFEECGNYEGKECRFGTFWSIFWAACTSATANGSVNCSLSSLLPLVGGVPLAFIQLGETIFGGIGTGVTNAIAFLLIGVFTAGLLVGRTPEYLGKKIEIREIKYVSLWVIIPAILTLIGSAWALRSSFGIESISEKSLHGIFQVIYAFSSASANNGSLFSGLALDTPFYSFLLSGVMFIGRIFPAALLLALASSIAQKKKVAENIGSLSTQTVSFAVWFIFVICIIGALSFFPIFSLGPIMEHLMLFHS